MIKQKQASRNTIKFNNDDIIDYTIVNKPLQQLLQSLKLFLDLEIHNNVDNVDNVLIPFNVKWHIKCNNINWLCIVNITFSNCTKNKKIII